MLATTIGFSIRVWVAGANPDSSVQNAAGLFPDVGEFFMNTSNGAIFLCTQGGASQTWQCTTDTAVVQSLITASASRVQSSATRTLNTPFQVSTSRDSLINYSVDVGTSSSLVGGQTGTVFLEISTSSTFASGIQEVARFANGNAVSLAIAITVTQNITGTLSGFIPAGYYCRLRTENTVGTPTFTYRSGQEVLL